MKLRSSGTLVGKWSCKDLQRVIENLITNAVKYGYDASPITLTLMDLGGEVELSVHNFGNPIPQEDQRNLFEAFERARAADSGTKKGWGLGLTLIRGVAEAHGGSARVRSDPEAGTTFTVRLPRDSRAKAA
ncbi:MAG: sensor histidine kinase [Bdellovibrionota bacterium]